LQAEYPRAYALIAECLARVASGEVRVRIDRAFPLSEAAQAHAYIEGRNAFGRVVLTA
jgi:NADPH2:quinone reductase